MGLMIDRAALAIFLSRYPDGGEFWPDRLDELVSGPPFDADGYRDMARAVLEEMREPTVEMFSAVGSDYGPALEDNWKTMIDGALKRSPPAA